MSQRIVLDTNCLLQIIPFRSPFPRVEVLTLPEFNAVMDLPSRE